MDRRAIVARSVGLLDFDPKTQEAKAGVLNAAAALESPEEARTA